MNKRNEATAITEEKKTVGELKSTKGMVLGKDVSNDFRPHFVER